MSKDLEELKTRKEQGSSGMTKGRVYGQIIALKISLCIGLLLKQEKSNAHFRVNSETICLINRLICRINENMKLK